jgi:hypothetical protein
MNTLNMSLETALELADEANKMVFLSKYPLAVRVLAAAYLGLLQKEQLNDVKNNHKIPNSTPTYDGFWCDNGFGGH